MSEQTKSDADAKREVEEFLLSDYREVGPRHKAAVLEIVGKIDEIYRKYFPEPLAGEVGSELAMVGQLPPDFGIPKLRGAYYVYSDKDGARKFLQSDGTWGVECESVLESEAAALAFLKERGEGKS